MANEAKRLYATRLTTGEIFQNWDVDEMWRHIEFLTDQINFAGLERKARADSIKTIDVIKMTINNK